jgi:hypothetical protein
MTDPELQAAMRLLSAPLQACFSNFHLFCLHLCRMVNLSMQHGTTPASTHAYGYLGSILGPVFHRYSEGYRFVKLACDLVEKHGFLAYQAKTYFSMGVVALSTQSVTTAIDFYRAAFRAAIEIGDLPTACFSRRLIVSGLLLRSDPLDAVWRESEQALDFVRQVPRPRGRHRESAALHRDHAGPDDDLIHLQRCAV